MAELASKSQLRMSLFRHALVTVPAVLLFGTVSGALAGAGGRNAWYAALAKPDFTPPGWVFGIVWPLLYVLLGLALALLLHARGARGRPRVLALLAFQLALNFAWPFVFFTWHDAELALTMLAGMAGVTAALVFLSWRIRPLAALLLVPYFAWLVFAAALNFEIVRLNPDAGAVAPPGAGTDIVL